MTECIPLLSHKGILLDRLSDLKGGRLSATGEYPDYPHHLSCPRCLLLPRGHRNTSLATMTFCRQFLQMKTLHSSACEAIDLLATDKGHALPRAATAWRTPNQPLNGASHCPNVSICPSSPPGRLRRGPVCLRSGGLVLDTPARRRRRSPSVIRVSRPLSSVLPHTVVPNSVIPLTLTNCHWARPLRRFLGLGVPHRTGGQQRNRRERAAGGEQRLSSRRRFNDNSLRQQTAIVFRGCRF